MRVDTTKARPLLDSPELKCYKETSEGNLKGSIVIHVNILSINRREKFRSECRHFSDVFSGGKFLVSRRYFSAVDLFRERPQTEIFGMANFIVPRSN